MSYSRWSNSYWYTYRCTQSKDIKENRNNAIFEICDVTSFTAQQLRTNMEECLEKVKNILIEWGQWYDSKEDDELLQELQEYMFEFLQDVDKEYQLEEWELVQQKQQEDIEYQKFKERMYKEFEDSYYDDVDSIVLRILYSVSTQYKNSSSSLAAKGLFERTLEYVNKFIKERDNEE